MQHLKLCDIYHNSYKHKLYTMYIIMLQDFVQPYLCNILNYPQAIPWMSTHSNTAISPETDRRGPKVFPATGSFGNSQVAITASYSDSVFILTFEATLVMKCPKNIINIANLSLAFEWLGLSWLIFAFSKSRMLPVGTTCIRSTYVRRPHHRSRHRVPRKTCKRATVIQHDTTEHFLFFGFFRIYVGSCWVARRLAQWKEAKKKVSSKHPAHGPAKRPGHLEAKLPVCSLSSRSKN